MSVKIIRSWGKNRSRSTGAGYSIASCQNNVGVQWLALSRESLKSTRSLHSNRSPLPIEATESLVRKIFTRYKVDPAFLHVLSSFGDNPHLSECGSSNISNTVTSNESRSEWKTWLAFEWDSDMVLELAYQTRYSEKSKKITQMPWNIRQTGVYHHHGLKPKKFDLFILIHPIRESVLEEQLLDSFQTGAGSADAKALCEHPFRFHLLPFTLYVDNWRGYLRSLTDDFSKNVSFPFWYWLTKADILKNDVVITLDLKTVTADSQGFDKVQELRDLKDDALSLSAFCKASQDVIKTLKEVPESGLEGIWDLGPFDVRLEGFKQNLSILSSRISNSIDLVSPPQFIKMRSCWSSIILAVFLCARSQKSVHCGRNQRKCISSLRKNDPWYDRCQMDHIPDSVLCTRKLCIRKSMISHLRDPFTKFPSPCTEWICLYSIKAQTE